MKKEIDFKTLYTPIKSGIIGDISKHSHSENGVLIQQYQVQHNPAKSYGKKTVYCVFVYRNLSRRYYYGTTIREIKALRDDINDFLFDPQLFLTL